MFYLHDTILKKQEEIYFKTQLNVWTSSNFLNDHRWWKWHYLTMKSWSRLLKKIILKNNGNHYCIICLHPLRVANKHKSHESERKDHDYCLVGTFLVTFFFVRFCFFRHRISLKECVVHVSEPFFELYAVKSKLAWDFKSPDSYKKDSSEKETVFFKK